MLNFNQDISLDVSSELGQGYRFRQKCLLTAVVYFFNIMKIFKHSEKLKNTRIFTI